MYVTSHIKKLISLLRSNYIYLKISFSWIKRENTLMSIHNILAIELIFFCFSYSHLFHCKMAHIQYGHRKLNLEPY